MSDCRTCLSMERDQARSAAELWTTLAPDSSIDRVTELSNEANPIVIDLTIAGGRFQILGAPGMGEPTMASSFTLVVPGQPELDRFWDGILEAGGEELECSWIRDPFGFYWQVLPQVFADAADDENEAVSQAAAEVVWRQKRVIADEVDQAVKAARGA